MKTVLKISIISILAFFASLQHAQAYGSYHSSSYGSGDSGWMAKPSGIYYFTQQSTPSTTTTVTRMVGDINVGYHYNLLYFGGEYNYDAQQTTGSGPASTDSYRSYGGIIGLETENLYLDFSYFFSSVGTRNGGTTSAIDYTNGTGFQVGLGYLFSLGGGWSLGPAINYKSLTYTTVNNVSQNFTFSTLVPHVEFKYIF